ncbi:BTAD domain-containing putative transcriptional regulator [Clostridiaceae bacterium HSG29]|nr:BTAD domain-containing putative transcriptional regulator [Clostridiaceae bacterium HSG29]
MSRIKFTLLGNPNIFLNEKRITDEFSSKSKALIFYLLLNSNKTYSREYLSFHLWPNSNKKAAFSNLRYNLWKINNYFEKSGIGDIIYTKNDKIGLIDIFDYESDLNNLIDLKKSDELIDKEKVRILYKGDFLEGFYLRESLDYNDWVFFEREKIQRIYIEILNSLLKLYEDNKMYNKTISLLENMIQIDPYNEILYSKIINVFLFKDDKVFALKYYNKCVNILREDLNISPKESTKKLLARIKNKVDNENNIEIENKKIKLNIEYIEGINNDFFYINQILKQIYENLGVKLKLYINPNYLCEIAKLCINYEQLIDINENNNRNKSIDTIRIYDSIIEFFRLLGNNYYIEIQLIGFIKMDELSKSIIKRIDKYKNIRIIVK